MLCCLNNVSDVPLMVEFTDSGTHGFPPTIRDEVLQPGEAAFYYDECETATKETWDFVEWGWLVDQDIEEDQEVRGQWDRILAMRPYIHNWAIEGF